MIALIQAHRSQDSGSNVAQNPILLFQTPSLGCICHDKWYGISSVTGLWGTLIIQHLLCIAMVGCDEEDVSMFFACLIDNTNRGISVADSLNCGVVDTSVPNHVWRRKIVHQKFEVSFGDAFTELISNRGTRHPGIFVIGSDSRGRNHISGFVLKLQLYSPVEEESYLFHRCD